MTTFNEDTVGELLDAFAARAVSSADYFGDEFPDYFDVRSGRWHTGGFWTEGFWPGLLWLLHGHSHDERLAAHARRLTRLLTFAKADMDDHDLGFLYQPSCVLGHEATGEDWMLEQALAAARRLAARFLPEGRYIPAHGPVSGATAGFAIIDTTMNLEILLWAARETEDEKFTRAALGTAHTIAREHVREDGSSCQVLWLDPKTGRTLRRDAIMAATVDSCWSRGQAWGIHGFAAIHRLAHDADSRDVAARMADYFLSRMPADGVVYHDLDDPAAPDVPRDASAQAIAASGLLILAQSLEGQERARWMAAAEGLLGALVRDCVVLESAGSVPPRGLLTRACKSLRKQQGVVSEIVFGDYYFVSALIQWLRLKRESDTRH